MTLRNTLTKFALFSGVFAVLAMQVPAQSHADKDKKDEQK
jgi:hypothetical protein